MSTSACDLFIHRNKNSGLTNTTKEDEKECKHLKPKMRLECSGTA